MRMSMGHLETLVWIARLGSFRAAAARLHLTQPTISMRVRELEAQVGVALFDRRSYRARLTPRGREVVGYAEQILGLADRMTRQSPGRRRLSGPIRLGVADSFALTCLPDLLLQIEKHHPEAQIEVVVDFSANLDAALQRGTLDIAMLTAPTPSPVIHVEKLIDLPLKWVASPRLGLPDRILTPADLRAYPIITNPSPSHLFGTIRGWFAKGRAEPKRLNTCNSLTIMIQLAAAGFGVSLLPVGLLQREIASGKLRALRTRPGIAPHPAWIAYRRDTPGQDLEVICELARPLVHGSVPG
ncbi:MAG: LysR family transcriptional regulator [Proteobacteria bacterium]|nr:LysR family transcriptional regulator [Pseudomonadota bacterium]